MYKAVQVLPDRKRRTHRSIIASLAGVTILTLGTLTLLKFLWLRQRNTIREPFSNQLIADTKFALYYPTRLPTSYHIDTSSIRTPQPGIVVFDLQNSSGQKIYISQEARPAEFNFGGYYNDFSDLREQITGQSTIATGYINDGRTVIGSLVINGTWVIVNTTTGSTSPSSIATLLHSLKQT